MYLLKLEKSQMEKLYKLREFEKEKGNKCSIVGLVREAIERYLEDRNSKKEVISHR